MLFDKILPPAHIHMIGIGGISMSGLAEILKFKGYIVTGSDINSSHIIDKLKANGIKVFLEHNAQNIGDASAVIFTASIKKDNPEFIEAKKLNIPLIERSELLGEITQMYTDTIAISGTHGKTTTTGMISVAFLECFKDPTISIGGELPNINSNYRIGNSNFLITEACEYVESFLKFFPFCSVVLNIEEDHLDYFRDIEHIKSAFGKFLDKLPANGYAIVNADDANCMEVAKNAKANLITFGTKNNANFKAKNIELRDGKSYFDLYKDNSYITKIELSIPGIHNVYNALACLAVCSIYNLSIDNVADALFKFTGVKRRFEFKGEFNNILVYDDYAHHPSEIKATLASAKTKNPKKLWCVFQPHTYSRTKALLNDFSNAFFDADEVIITDIYAAREKDTGEISSKDLVNKIKNTSNNATYISNFDDISKYLHEHAKPGDIIFTVGAGNIFEVGERLLSNFTH